MVNTSSRKSLDPSSDGARRQQETEAVEIPQWSLARVLAVWATAALPMGILAWVMAPLLAAMLSGEGNVPMAKALFISLTIGLIWQFMVVTFFVWSEQHNLRWSTVREVLWLRPPLSPRTGRQGGRVWLVLIPLAVLFAVGGMFPSLPAPAERDVSLFLQSSTGEAFLHGAWSWFALMLVMMVFNTVLGEELLFRGLLLPRMNGVFGRYDWVANGVLFATYHLHMPWRIPTIFLDALLLAYPSKRYQSSWIGIAVHSIQTLFFAGVVFGLVV